MSKQTKVFIQFNMALSATVNPSKHIRTKAPLLVISESEALTQ